MGWIDGFLEKTVNALRFKNVGIRSFSSAVRLLSTGPVVIDSFFIGQVTAANYFIQAESSNGITESLYANVVVNMTPDKSTYLANMVVYGRVSTGVQLVTLTATVDKGQVFLNAEITAGATGTIQVRRFPTYMETIYGN